MAQCIMKGMEKQCPALRKQHFLVDEHKVD